MDPALQLSYEVLKQRPDVAHLNLAEAGPQELDMDTVEPLAVEGQTALIASMQVGGIKKLQVWGSLDHAGKLDRRGVIVTEESYNPHDPESSFVAVHAGQPARMIGRADAQASSRLHLPGSVSRQHLQMEVTPEGKLKIADLNSKYGTELIIKQGAAEALSRPAAQAAESVVTAVVQEQAPQFEDRFKSVHEDPLFQQLTGPYTERLQAVNKDFLAKKKGLEQAMEQAHYHDAEEYDRLDAQLRKLDESYRAASEQARNELEAVVKPYLAERLRLLQADKSIGYTNPGELSAKDQKLVSRAGKTIAHYLPGMKGRYMQTSVRLGQVELPARLSSWAGSSGEKTNHQTGVKTTSSRHIVDLAAAMVSGNWKSEHEPIILQRDVSAELDLPKELQGKMPVYKVRLGMHRIAAMRLIDGLDGVADANEVIEAG